jgi:hypothetical protein
MNRTFGAVLLVVAGCGTTKIVQYAEPMPTRVQASPVLDMSDVSKPWKRDPIKVSALEAADRSCRRCCCGCAVGQRPEAGARGAAEVASGPDS